MSLLLIAEPDLSDEDQGWIESIRERHDPQFHLVPAHFTLVFPVDSIDQSTFVGHCSHVARSSGPIEFRLYAALVHKDPLIDTTHVYLVPDEGLSALNRLHGRMYTGPLARALRLDIPFVPHMTVATYPTPEPAHQLADQLNGPATSVAGVITAVRAIQYDGRAVTTLAQVRLGNGPG